MTGDGDAENRDQILGVGVEMMFDEVIGGEFHFLVKVEVVEDSPDEEVILIVIDVVSVERVARVVLGHFWGLTGVG